MCGIAGFLDVSRQTPGDELQRRVALMTAALSHRGPDEEGAWIDEQAGVALGHRRLSILDLSPTGSQPMRSACERYVISINGEIYNFRALREELQQLGHTFVGTSDTEVALAATSAWGVARAVEKFNGMFAFALWDRHVRRLHLGRDRFGEKPLYYGWAGQVFLFGSELKALRQHPGFSAAIDRRALTLYLRYRYIPAPYSIYADTFKVRAGTIVTISANRSKHEPEVSVYWSARQVAEQSLADPVTSRADETADCLAALLSDSVRLRMESDRPVGAFLSGGIDSSTVVSLMTHVRASSVKTFSIGFEKRDEAVHARRVARHLGTDHTEQYVTVDDALAVIPRLPSLYDEPFADSSQIPMCLLSQLARRDVVVALTGDAGDELFCGYRRYGSPNEPPPPDADTAEGRIGCYRSRMSTWSEPARLVYGAAEHSDVLADPAGWIPAADLSHQMMLMDTLTYLPDDLLVKSDRAAMGVGLETRAPFLDHRVFQYAWRIPLGMKVKGDVRKWILRQVLSGYVPPTLTDRPKQGFEIPLGRWLRGGLRDWAESLLSPSRLVREGFFDPNPVLEKWSLHLAGQGRWKHMLWSILMFEAWLEHTTS